MSFGEPNNPYGQPQGQQPQGPGPQGPPQGQQPGYGYPGQAYGGVPQQGYGYPQAPPVGYGPQFGAPGMPTLAHWGLRFVATIIDGIIIGLPYYVLGIAGVAMESGNNGSNTTGALLVVIGFLGAVALGIWQLAKEGSTGQTIGKKAMKIRLLKEVDGSTLGFWFALGRRICHIVDSIACYIGWLWPLWDAKKQTFADKICSTVVVRAQ